jgi:elongation factor P hydroxylase
MMPLFDVEMTVSVSGRMQIEAETVEAAREAANRIQAVSADFMFTGPATELQDDFSPDVEIGGVSLAEDQDEVADEGEKC